MRIIGGRLKGRVLPLPSSLPVQPTMSVAREGLFNILEHRVGIEGKTVMDLFAGTGAVGIEFLSRGARTVHAVEKNPLMVKWIKTVKQKWDLKDLIIHPKDVYHFLNFTQLKADIIFADPFYADPFMDEIVQYVFSRNLLQEDGLLILEHGEKKSFQGHEFFLEERSYGNVHFTFFSVKKREF